MSEGDFWDALLKSMLAMVLLLILGLITWPVVHIWKSIFHMLWS